VFLFSAPDGNSINQIFDFDDGVDQVQISDSGFGDIAPGNVIITNNVNLDGVGGNNDTQVVVSDATNTTALTTIYVLGDPDAAFGTDIVLIA
jgi:hypothetical protein